MRLYQIVAASASSRCPIRANSPARVRAPWALRASWPLQGVVDRFDELADAAEIAGAAGFAFAVGAKEVHSVERGLAVEFVARKPCSTSSRATSRSPILRSARHRAIGMPSAVVIRYSLIPQYQRDSAAQ